MKQLEMKNNLDEIAKAYLQTGDTEYIINSIKEIRENNIFENFSNKTLDKLLEHIDIEIKELEDNCESSLFNLSHIAFYKQLDFSENELNDIMSIINIPAMKPVVDNFITSFGYESYLVPNENTIVDMNTLVEGLSNSLANLILKDAIYELNLEEDGLNKENILQIGKEVANIYNNAKYLEIYNNKLNDNKNMKDV